MCQNGCSDLPTNEIARYFNNATLETQQETLGHIVVDILRAGQSLSCKSICTRLLHRLENAETGHDKEHYQELIRLLFARAP